MPRKRQRNVGLSAKKKYRYNKPIENNKNVHSDAKVVLQRMHDRINHVNRNEEVTVIVNNSDENNNENINNMSSSDLPNNNET